MVCALIHVKGKLNAFMLIELVGFLINQPNTIHMALHKLLIGLLLSFVQRMSVYRKCAITKNVFLYFTLISSQLHLFNGIKIQGIAI